MRNVLIKKCVGIVLALCASHVFAGNVVVIVNPGAGVTTLTQDDVSRIFLAKTKTFPNEKPALPINQNEGSAARSVFEDKVLKKTPSQVNAYWTQLLFTGKGTPPKDAGADADVKKLVADNPNVIGYIDSAAVDATVVVVYTSE